MRTKIVGAAAGLLILATFGVAPAFAQPPPGFVLPPLLMQSTAFEDGGIVPQKYAGRGGVQPGFTFSNAPDNTQSYAIIFHDLDVALQGGTGDVLHWMAWNIPAAAKGIPEGKLPDGSVTARTSRVRTGTSAPARPRARGITITCSSSTRCMRTSTCRTRRAVTELIAAMEGKTVAKAAYVGRFKGTPRTARLMIPRAGVRRQSPALGNPTNAGISATYRVAATRAAVQARISFESAPAPLRRAGDAAAPHRYGAQSPSPASV